MAEYMVADPLWTVKLPEDMPFEVAAPLMCAGSTMYNSIQRAKMPTGSIVAIIGLGGLGHLGKSCLLNHSYTIPECYLGSLTQDLRIAGWVERMHKQG